MLSLFRPSFEVVKKDGFYTSFQVTGDFLYTYLTVVNLDQKSLGSSQGRSTLNISHLQSQNQVCDLLIFTRFAYNSIKYKILSMKLKVTVMVLKNMR
jgi:hypothetical protein